ncbi:MAG: hypothetical protein K2N28_03040 [Muribaculaceae bacterium]|nr:hypothetical protein [Muribaculaceae bacterium]
MDNQFVEGFNYASQNAGTFWGGDIGHQYVGRIDSAIQEFTDRINSFKGYNTPTDRLQGDIAEMWHGGTFNINAAVNDSKYSATIDRSHGFASPDIRGNWKNSDYGLKYYKFSNKSVNAQALSYFQRYKEYNATHEGISFEQFLRDRNLPIDTSPFEAIYSGQLRLIPSDQMEAAIAYLDIKIEKELKTRPEQALRFQEVRNMLTSCIKSPDGTSSFELDRKSSERLAQLAKEGNFSPADEGLTLDNLVHFEHIIRQGVKAGLSAAVITLVMKTAPNIYKCIDQLVTQGYVSNEQLEDLGASAFKGTSESFLRGFIAGTLTVSCKSGQLGATLQSISADVIGALTVIIFQTFADSIALAKGSITRAVLLNNLNKSILVSGIAIGTGCLLQYLLPALPFAYLLGNFVGSFIGSYIYLSADKAIISLAIEKGWTFFGLVDQDYILPKEVLDEIGIELFEYEKFLPYEFEYERFEPEYFQPEYFQPKMIRTLRRGVIAVHQVGYIYE